MTKVKNYDEIKEYLLSDVEDLTMLISAVNSWNGALDDLRFYENDDEFFNTFFYENPSDLVNKLCYGDYNTSHSYVGFDGYGNLQSYSAYDYKELLEDSIDEIIDEIVENVERIDIKNSRKFNDLYELITE